LKASDGHHIYFTFTSHPTRKQNNLEEEEEEEEWISLNSRHKVFYWDANDFLF
jgi:hypothetical protein